MSGEKIYEEFYHSCLFSSNISLTRFTYLNAFWIDRFVEIYIYVYKMGVSERVEERGILREKSERASRGIEGCFCVLSEAKYSQ